MDAGGDLSTATTPTCRSRFTIGGHRVLHRHQRDRPFRRSLGWHETVNFDYAAIGGFFATWATAIPGNLAFELMAVPEPGTAVLMGLGQSASPGQRRTAADRKMGTFEVQPVSDNYPDTGVCRA